MDNVFQQTEGKYIFVWMFVIIKSVSHETQVKERFILLNSIFIKREKKITGKVQKKKKKIQDSPAMWNTFLNIFLYHISKNAVAIQFLVFREMKQNSFESREKKNRFENYCLCQQLLLKFLTYGARKKYASSVIL